jgi:hypothetical protein
MPPPLVRQAQSPSAQLGALLLRGHTMLAEACPSCNVSGPHAAVAHLLLSRATRQPAATHVPRS